MLSHAATVSARALHRVGVGDVARRAAAARGFGVGRRVGGGRRLGGSGTSSSSRRPRVARVFDRRAFRGGASDFIGALAGKYSANAISLVWENLHKTPLSEALVVPSAISGLRNGAGSGLTAV